MHVNARVRACLCAFLSACGHAVYAGVRFHATTCAWVRVPAVAIVRAQDLRAALVESAPDAHAAAEQYVRRALCVGYADARALVEQVDDCAAAQSLCA